MAKAAKYKVYNGSAWVELTFTPSSHTHSEYLPLTGGTITGDLSVADGHTINSSYVIAGVIGCDELGVGPDDNLYIGQDGSISTNGVITTRSELIVGPNDDVVFWYDGDNDKVNLSINGYIHMHSHYNGLNFTDANGFFNAEDYPGIATDDGSILVSRNGFANDGIWFYFPEGEEYLENGQAYIIATTEQGDSGQVLTSNGDGTFKWSNASGGGSFDGTVSGDITFYNAHGIISGDGSKIGFNDEGVPCIVSSIPRTLGIVSGDGNCALDDMYNYYEFPNFPGKVLVAPESGDAISIPNNSIEAEKYYVNVNSGLESVMTGSSYGFDEDGCPVIMNTDGYYLTMKTDITDSGHIYDFPTESGTVALTSYIPKYMHHIQIADANKTFYICYLVISTKSDSYTASTLFTEYGTNAFPASGVYTSGSTEKIITKIALQSSSTIRLVYGATSQTTVQSFSSFTDAVIPMK